MKHIYILISLIFVSLCANAQSATYTNNAPITVNDNTIASTYSSNILVSGFTGTISDVGVVIKDFSHGTPSDVAICIQAPSGEAILMQDQMWGAPAANITYMISDLGSSRVGTFDLPANGTYKPTANSALVSFNAPGPGTTYSNPGPANSGVATMGSTFGSATANGTWKLWIIDVSNGDAGTITGGWELRINPNVGLPIELADFHLECESADILMVDWTTFNEENSKDFTIQVSSDGAFFEDVRTVNASGNSQIEMTYKASIEMPYAKTYVRLMLRDITGQLGYSAVREASCGTQLPIKVSPNPITEGYVIIDNPSGELMKYELTDLNGRVILKGTSKSVHHRLNMNTGVPKGIYLLHVKSGDEEHNFKLNNL